MMLDHRYDGLRVSYVMPFCRYRVRGSSAGADWKIAADDVADATSQSQNARRTTISR